MYLPVFAISYMRKILPLFIGLLIVTAAVQLILSLRSNGRRTAITFKTRLTQSHDFLYSGTRPVLAYSYTDLKGLTDLHDHRCMCMCIQNSIHWLRSLALVLHRCLHASTKRQQHRFYQNVKYIYNIHIYTCGQIEKVEGLGEWISA